VGVIVVGDYLLCVVIDCYNVVWNVYDLDVIVVLHVLDMVFENHIVGEWVEGE